MFMAGGGEEYKGEEGELEIKRNKPSLSFWAMPFSFLSSKASSIRYIDPRLSLHWLPHVPIASEAAHREDELRLSALVARWS